IAQLRREMSQLTGHYVKPVKPEKQADYIAHGSDKHAGMLGLRKAKEDDRPQTDGWALEDIVSYGPTVSPEFLEQLLRQKVNELEMKIPKTQSRDPLAPHFAPVVWHPPMSLAQITE
ncbi:unnamed protein product, partial [marine sediment metagenome]